MKRRNFIKGGALFVPAALFTPKLLGQSVISGSVAMRGAASIQGSPVAGGGGPNVWYDVESSGTTDTDNFSASGFYFWSSIVPAASGTATKIRIFSSVNMVSAANLKAALYNSGATSLLASAPSTAATFPNAYTELTFTSSVAVTASTTYKIAWTTDSDNMAFRYLLGAGTVNYAGGAYADFPVADLSILSGGTQGKSYAVGVFVA